MTIKQIYEKINSSEYDFLRTDPHLGSNVVLIGVAGSHAYGTNIESSDLDIRGCALNTKEEILGRKNFDQRVDNSTDTTIYSFNKLIQLLTNANPNVIELLGLKPEHYLLKTAIGEEIVANKELFISQRAVRSFGGYATQQLRRLDSKSAYNGDAERKENHKLNSIINASYEFENRYMQYESDSVKLYVEKTENGEADIFMDISLKRYPLRDYLGLTSEMANILKDYDKIGKRNKNAIAHDKIGKHMMHLFRLYMMGLDILESGKIITYREKEHDFLMEVLNGKFLDSNNQLLPGFFEALNEYEKRFEYAKNNTSIPVNPDMKKIEEFVMSVNERIVKGDI